MSGTAEAILEYYRNLIWKKVNIYLQDPRYPETFEIPKKYTKLKQFHWNLTKEYPKRKGKYLRPTLLTLTCEAMGHSKGESLNTAAAMQISEEWLLIHDDFEDNSIQRRGKSTLHKMFGPELAINAGDALHVIMWKALLENKNLLGNQKAFDIAEEFSTMLTRTVIGQSIEIKWSKENKDQISNEDWYFICDGKTSYYTIAGPMRLGAIISNATNSELEALAKFGKYLGRCFQLVDDILDLTSDFKGLKKQKGNDIWEGKKTIILGHLLRNATAADKKRVMKILKKDRQQKTQQEIDWIMEKIGQYNSIDYAKNLATSLKDKAYQIFENELQFLSKNDSREKLKTLINFILERDH